MFLTQGQLILCLQSISICISSNVISSNGSSGEGVCSGLASSATLAAASVGAGRGGACQTGRRSREVAVRAVNAGTRCIRRRGRAAPRPGAAGSRVHAVSGCPAAGKGPAGGRAARRGATGGWIQASGSFWRRPRTPARPSPGPAAPPHRALLPRVAPVLCRRPHAAAPHSASRSAPCVAGTCFSPSPSPGRRGARPWAPQGVASGVASGAAASASRTPGGWTPRSSASRRRRPTAAPAGTVAPESCQGGRVPPPASGGPAGGPRAPLSALIVTRVLPARARLFLRPEPPSLHARRRPRFGPAPKSSPRLPASVRAPSPSKVASRGEFFFLWGGQSPTHSTRRLQ